MGKLNRWDIIKMFFKQLFCKHNYRADYLPMQNRDYLICIKCGKAISRLEYFNNKEDETIRKLEKFVEEVRGVMAFGYETTEDMIKDLEIYLKELER